MITWGANRPNANRQQQTSIGAIATGDRHVHIPFRLQSGDGASLHPLQRAGQVSAASNRAGVRMRAAGPPGLGDASSAMVPYVNQQWPPVVPIAGGVRDPAMQVA
jgi:hypothetical protein